MNEVGSVSSCLQCSRVLEDELAYLRSGVRNYQRQAHRISRVLRFLGKTQPIYSLSQKNTYLPYSRPLTWVHIYISDQKANKSSVVADTGQVLSSVVWGENANESKVIKQLFFYQHH